MQVLRNILNQWNELWRYPELIVALDRTDAEESSSEIFAKGLIVGLASPQSPRDCFLSLLRVGEFQSAECVLETAGFVGAVNQDDYEALFQELDKARREAVEDVGARIAALQARASRVGLPGMAPVSVDDVVEKRVPESQSTVDRWEAEIRAKEAEVTGEIRRRLGEATDAIDAETTLGTAAWNDTVERCLKAREYEAARFLMESGPAGGVPDEPLFVPRRPQWPWIESLGEVLQWFQGTQPSPHDFQARWRHDSDDKPAVRLLSSLEQVADSGVTDGDSARELACALDGFLGREATHRKVVARGDWFETTLHGLDDPRLPCFARNDSVGVRLWIPKISEAEPLDGVEGDASDLCFQPDQNVQCPNGVVGFDSWTLLRLFADRDHRRLNFLREIGGKIELEAVVPADVSCIRLPPMAPGEMRSYAAWVLDIVNMEVADPAVVDVIVYYTGSAPRLALNLLRTLFESISSRRAVIELDDIKRAWQSRVFRNAACSELLGPLDGDPMLRAVLGTALYVGLRPGGSFSAEDICLAIEMFQGDPLDEATARTCLDRLTSLRLIEVSDTNDSYRIPVSGVGSILLDAIVDSEEYATRALKIAARP
ncbi:MAG: hypothetical protein OXU81_10200 [Gammaproteobacteria bacterium]|nr:hypothetical protein [Gammaproteobacteria bacterium]